jgi:hypothetical protein
MVCWIYSVNLFISVLLHGNELSGWNALRTYLSEQPVPPRSMFVLIGNLAAAKAGVRTLPDQIDYNRIWKQTESEHGVVEGVRSHVLGQELFAAIDLHNNTGKNPAYAVLTSGERANHSLAQCFSDKAVYLDKPDTVLTRLFDGHCPSVTLELGPINDERSDARALDFLRRLMLLDDLEEPVSDLSIYRTRARVHVAENASIGFADILSENRDIVFTGGLEGVNFHPLAQDTEFGRISVPLPRALRVVDDHDVLVTDQFFRVDGGVLLLTQSVIPAMFTTDEEVVRQDCLCYLMEELPSI